MSVITIAVGCQTFSLISTDGLYGGLGIAYLIGGAYMLMMGVGAIYISAKKEYAKAVHFSYFLGFSIALVGFLVSLLTGILCLKSSESTENLVWGIYYLVVTVLYAAVGVISLVASQFAFKGRSFKTLGIISSSAITALAALGFVINIIQVAGTWETVSNVIFLEIAIMLIVLTSLSVITFSDEPENEESKDGEKSE